MEIIQIGSDKGENDNAVIPSEGWDNTPLCLGLTAATQAQKLMPFLTRVNFFRAVSSIWNVRVR